MGTDGERAALVSGRGLYTEEKSGQDDEEGVISEPPQAQLTPHNILGQFHEDALTQVGVGSYQWLLCATAGFCIMADGVQVFITPYLETSVQAEMCIDDSYKSWLEVVSMIGLFVGALTCPLADHVGRRSLLLFGLTLHLIFNIAAAFTPTLWVFMASRFGSSFGLGICYPIGCVYFAEFLPLESRGRLGILLLFWALGGFYVVLFACALLPASAEEVIYEVKEHQSAWHRVLLLSSLPTVFALASLSCLSESVRYLLHIGKDVDAIIMYQQMYKWNASRSAQYQLTELELPSKVNTAKPPPAKTIWAQMSYNVSKFLQSFKLLGSKQNLTTTLFLCVIWSSLGFSYYGISQLIPARLQDIADGEYNSKVDAIQDETEIGTLFDVNLENKLFSNVTFESCTFAHISMSHVTFDRCHLINVDFSNIISSKTFFNHSRIESSRLIDTDFTEDRFVECTIANTTILSLVPPCRTDLDFKLKQTDLITENIVRLFCPFAAFLLFALWFQRVKRPRIGVIALIICGLSPLCSSFLLDRTSLLVLDFLWGTVFLFAFNAVNIITVEAYPVNLRATGFGLCFAFFRAAGCAALHELPLVPLIFGLLLVGSFSLHKLPDTSNNLM